MEKHFALSKEIEKIAREELHEDPDRRQKDIEYIREWLQKQPHINARTDDWAILRFLRGCKFSLESTKTKLDMFYTCKNLTPEWYLNRDPLDPKMKEIFQLGEFLPLPGYDDNGRKAMVVRLGRHNVNTISLDETLKNCQIIMDLLLEEDVQLSVTGFTWIIDLKDYTAGHALQATPSLIKKMFTIWQAAYPIRIKAIHYFNVPPVFLTLLNIAMTFMKEKLKKRIHVHGDGMESLFEHVPKRILPKEYGGTNGNIQELIDYWCNKAIKNREWLMEDEKYKVDESKRPGKPHTSSELFGIDGSFRKLNID